MAKGKKQRSDAAKSAEHDTTKTETRGDQMLELAQAYFALDAPPILPSGVPNIWSLRVYTVPAPPIARHGPHGKVDVPAANDVVMLALYDVAKGQPVFTEPNACLLCVRDDTADYDTAKLPPPLTVEERAARDKSTDELPEEVLATQARITKLSMFALYYLFTEAFVGTNGSAHLNETFVKAMPTLGTFRPAAIHFHDATLLDAWEYAIGLQREDYGTLFPELSMWLTPLKDQALASPTNTGRVSCGPAAVTQMIVLCAHCVAAGVHRSGSSDMKRLFPCGRCNVVW